MSAVLERIAHVDGVGSPVVVGVDGGGGAGKSTVAAAIAVARGDVRILHLDDFYADSPRRLDTTRVVHALGALRRGETVRFRRYDWWLHADAEWHVLDPDGVIVVEGVYALRAELADLYHVTVWVETPREVRLERGLERDGEAARSEWTDWMADEDRYFDERRPHVLADVVVSGDGR